MLSGSDPFLKRSLIHVNALRVSAKRRDIAEEAMGNVLFKLSGKIRD